MSDLELSLRGAPLEALVDMYRYYFQARRDPRRSLEAEERLASVGAALMEKGLTPEGLRDIESRIP